MIRKILSYIGLAVAIFGIAALIIPTWIYQIGIMMTEFGEDA